MADSDRIERACAAFWDNWSTVCRKETGLEPWAVARESNADSEAVGNMRELMRLALEAADG